MHRLPTSTPDRPPSSSSTRPLAQAEAVARAVLVRALLEHRERREREAADAEERRLRQRDERRQLGSCGRAGDRPRARRRARAGLFLGPGSSPSRRPPPPPRDGRSTRTSRRASPRTSSSGRVAALRRAPRRPRAGRAPTRSASAPRVAAEVDRAGDDQPLLRARHRDVVEAQALGPLRLLRAPP